MDTRRQMSEMPYYQPRYRTPRRKPYHERLLTMHRKLRAERFINLKAQRHLDKLESIIDAAHKIESPAREHFLVEQLIKNARENMHTEYEL